MSSDTKVQLCGRLFAVIEGRDITGQLADRSARELFAYLAAHRLQPVGVDALRGLLPGLDDTGFLDTFGQVRAAVGHRLEGQSELQLRLPVGSVVDVETAAEAVHRAEAAVARQDWRAAWPASRVALHVARRTFLPGSDAPWVLAQRDKMHAIEVRAHECVAAIGLGIGGTEVMAAERSGRALIALEPIRESGYRFAMEAAVRRGNEAEAVQLYNQLRARLRDELGIEPGGTTRDLYQRITAGADPPAVAPSGGVAVQRTFVFTDIVSSTPLLAAVGDEAWESLVTWHDRTLRGCFGAFGGEEIDHAGDGFFVAFAAPDRAIACAIAIQRALDDHRREHGFAPQVRIGLHATVARGNDGKYLGRGVHEAARIGGLAEGGEIIASMATITGSNVPTTATREVVLKGIDQPVTVVTIEWRQDMR